MEDQTYARARLVKKLPAAEYYDQFVIGEVYGYYKGRINDKIFAFIYLPDDPIPVIMSLKIFRNRMEVLN